MTDNEKEKLTKLLGDEFSEAEIEEISKSFPQLSQSAQELQQGFEILQEEASPPLSTEFREQVLVRIEKRQWWRSIFSWPRFALASSLVTAGLLAWILIPGWMTTSVQPGPQIVRESSGPESQKLLLVRFAIHQPGAEKVSLVGDFNNWNELVLKKNSEGLFWGELKVPQGTYAYGFLVNGKEWTLDPKAPRQVLDGFGGQNSLVKL